MNSEQLRDFLSMAVPLRINEIQQSGIDPHTALEAFRADPAQMERLLLSESVMFAGAGAVDRNSAGAVITAVALLAFAPGGIKIFGLHFDAAKSWFYCRQCDDPYRLPSAELQNAVREAS